MVALGKDFNKFCFNDKFGIFRFSCKRVRLLYRITRQLQYDDFLLKFHEGYKIPFYRSSKTLKSRLSDTVYRATVEVLREHPAYRYYSVSGYR